MIKLVETILKNFIKYIVNNQEFITYINEAIRQEMLLGQARNEIKLQGLRNIKSDFTYISSNNTKMEAVDIVKRLYKEREENTDMYANTDRKDLWLQENTEKNLLKSWLPKEPSKEDVINFLNTLTEIPKQKSSFKKFQDACSEKFGQKIDSGIILEFLS